MAENPETHENHEQNEATKASDQFIAEKQNKFTRAIGTVLRTASTEFLTWFGGPLIPGGIIGAATILKYKEPVKKMVLERITSSQATTLAKIGEGQVSIGMDKLLKGLAVTGIGASVIGTLTSALGTAIGWSGAKHHEDTRKLFKLGKLVEFGGIAAQLLTGIPIYPITKAFSIGATFFSQLKRPGSF